ncbi:MAG: 2-oxoglutarate dehydrogenase complex dihydrolipoyllysine-residue succinyltransferase [Alphaproteobacteria bacterium]|nr:2-oxoglutarate dehydrogenase complex dihydrolipoyllysine-residue succinyltransferase [Alphaproteobacteria bacterium]
MTTEIKVPALGESVSEATVASWLKKPGDAVQTDETLVELETDKVTLEVNAPVSGILGDYSAAEGDTVKMGDLLGVIEEGASAAPSSSTQAKKEAEPEPKTEATPDASSMPASALKSNSAHDKLAPSVAKLASEQNITVSQVQGTGKDGRVLKGDLLAFSARGSAGGNASHTPGATAPQIALDLSSVAPAPQRATTPQDSPREERVKMTRLRKTIATRLKEAQNTAAMLTTFNEVDMTNVMAARKHYQEHFVKKHGVKLGFMSFFVKAALVALKEIPAVNAEIDGEDLVYKNHYDIGVAVSTPNGLVVPVIRDADRLGFSDVEKTIADLGVRARDGKLAMQELMGGTFTVTNGGTFGSLMSTPILNPPQSGILGMHKIQERPMVINGEIKVRPMMYLALSYDHRIIDGREAVTFLVRVKECIENPERILFDI